MPAAAPVKKADPLPAKKDGPVLTPASASPVKKAAAVMPVVTAPPKPLLVRDDAAAEAAAAEAAKQAAEAVEKFDEPLEVTRKTTKKAVKVAAIAVGAAAFGILLNLVGLPSRSIF
ncbi:hypothetical protein AURANDRAFT_61432 [Aureococcus anophagefferens]|uniref:Uncharacterized protein n=1 Tax=Aureococcus anophagefferens TaxID=44056 RepID=F0XYD5_AURAN|nr:hypothetical protein AURANDRAFT_61432 [Aureococcus anophagefferens]EGB12101.1 hypothetical protein AURANDRAFT_61432 [Aureococcus anophagefferens]|eukprot:XP_009033190.1 hypothetical protein AURANDRAFT_61432 [Aureococcus anophagefferens]